MSTQAFMNPNSAFITFETEAAYNAMYKKGSIKLFGQKTYLKEATEPTNIIWENMYLASLDRYKRMFYFSFVMAILFGATFLTTFLIKTKADEVNNKYEVAVCASL